MNLDELERLAKAATPGRWRYSPWHIEEGPAAVRGDGYGIVCGNFASDDTAKFVASLSPERVLALIAVVRAADDVSDMYSASGTGDVPGEVLHYDAARAKLEATG